MKQLYYLLYKNITPKTKYKKKQFKQQTLCDAQNYDDSNDTSTVIYIQ